MRLDPHAIAVWLPWALLTLLLWTLDAGWGRERDRRMQAERERDAWAREATWWRGVAIGVERRDGR